MNGVDRSGRETAEEASGEVHGQALMLDARAIEDELAKIRERESNPYLSGTKTNLFTLVIFEAVARDVTSRTLDHLLGKRPARIVTIGTGGGPSTSVRVSGRCSPDIRNRGVCFEEIGISNGEDGLGRDLGAWSPLLIRDLPVFLWWLDRLSPLPPLLMQATELIDKLIVDTAQCADFGEDPLAALGELAALREKTRGAVAVSDMAWKRIHALRVNSARLFNPEEARPRLSAISRVALAGGSRAEALLYFLWLAGRLGWNTAKDGKDFPAFTDSSGRRMQVIHSSQAPLSEGFHAAFGFSDGGGDLTIDCGKNGCVDLGSEKGAYRYLEDGEALIEEVDGLKQDAAFLEAIHAAAAARRSAGSGA